MKLNRQRLSLVCVVVGIFTAFAGIVAGAYKNSTVALICLVLVAILWFVAAKFDKE
jgi:hypothetical protein